MGNRKSSRMAAREHRDFAFPIARGCVVPLLSSDPANLLLDRPAP